MLADDVVPSVHCADGTIDITVDISVSYADDGRNHALRREWQRQYGAGAPVPQLTLPQRPEGSYAMHVRQKSLADVIGQRIQAGEHSGTCRYEDLIKTCIPLGGGTRYTVGAETFTADSGLVCASTNGAVWEWEAYSPTRLLVLLLPAGDVRFPRTRRSIMADQDTPAVRMLLAHVQFWAGVRDQLSPSASAGARNATLELFHGLLNDQVRDDDEFFPALVRAATDWIDSRLTDPDLSPRSVAAALHVSVRTLQRAFASESTSIMTYVRERRLERARLDLRASSATVAEVAARWNFADSSHFIKSYKNRYGHLPNTAKLKHQAL